MKIIQEKMLLETLYGNNIQNLKDHFKSENYLASISFKGIVYLKIDLIIEFLFFNTK